MVDSAHFQDGGSTGFGAANALAQREARSIAWVRRRTMRDGSMNSSSLNSASTVRACVASGGADAHSDGGGTPARPPAPVSDCTTLTLLISAADRPNTNADTCMQLPRPRITGAWRILADQQVPSGMQLSQNQHATHHEERADAREALQVLEVRVRLLRLERVAAAAALRVGAHAPEQLVLHVY
jgi:hypothetical protein